MQIPERALLRTTERRIYRSYSLSIDDSRRRIAALEALEDRRRLSDRLGLDQRLEELDRIENEFMVT